MLASASDVLFTVSKTCGMENIIWGWFDSWALPFFCGRLWRCSKRPWTTEQCLSQSGVWMMVRREGCQICFPGNVCEAIAYSG